MIVITTGISAPWFCRHIFLISLCFSRSEGLIYTFACSFACALVVAWGTEPFGIKSFDSNVLTWKFQVKSGLKMSRESIFELSSKPEIWSLKVWAHIATIFGYDLWRVLRQNAGWIFKELQIFSRPIFFKRSSFRIEENCTRESLFDLSPPKSRQRRTLISNPKILA